MSKPWHNDSNGLREYPAYAQRGDYGLIGRGPSFGVIVLRRMWASLMRTIAMCCGGGRAR